MAETTKQGDGGTAFPTVMHERRSDGTPYSVTVQGMSLRDYFAGQALAGYIAAYAHPQAIETPSALKAARCAYEYADAMLAAR